jgi:hypothetical protein
MAKDRMEKLDTDDFFAQIYDELECLRDSAERIEERINDLAIHIAMTYRNRRSR